MQYLVAPNLKSLVTLLVDQLIWYFSLLICFMNFLNLLSILCIFDLLSFQHGITCILLRLLLKLLSISKLLFEQFSPLLANLSASSFPKMPIWALTFLSTKLIFFFFS